MIYLIERRTVFGGGICESHYEVRSYTHKSSHTGALINGKTLKKGSMEQCQKYCRTKGIKAELY